MKAPPPRPSPAKREREFNASSAATRGPAAPDIDPESGCRLKLPRRDELDPEGQAIYDRLANPTGGNLRGGCAAPAAFSSTAPNYRAIRSR